jgi:hypothetical protein
MAKFSEKGVPARAPKFDVKLKDFLEEEPRLAENLFLNNPWLVRRGISEYNTLLGCDIMDVVLGYLSKGRCRLLDYGAGEGRLNEQIRKELSALDKKEGTDYRKRFRGISVNLTDYHLIRKFERQMLRENEIPLLREARFKTGPGQYETGEIRSYLEHRREFERFKKQHLKQARGLGSSEGYIVGDVRDSLKLGGDTPRVQVVVSVGTLFYIPEIIEVVEDVYNNRLVMGGTAFLELGPTKDLFEVVTPKGRVRSLGDLFDHMRASDKYGVRVKSVEVEGNAINVIEMHKKRENLELPVYLYDLLPRPVKHPSSITVTRQYKSAVEF